MTFKRRDFLTLSGAGAASLAMPAISLGQAKPKVVVVGGGAGGATAARYIAKDSKGGIDVTLIEATKRYYACFFSNLYLGGFRDYASIGHGYDGLAAQGVNVVHDWAANVDTAGKKVTLASGASVSYDKLILSPGIDMKYDSVAGYSVEAQRTMPHGWKSGTQVQQLRAQVLAMKQGGTFVMVPPPNPYRCPPGPYERVSMIAHMLKQSNPTAKIIILDPKPKFSKQALFHEGWDKHYSGMIDWLGPDVHGGILSVNADTMEIETDLDIFKADAASVIPAQKAGAIAMAAGVTDGDWAPINPVNMASKADDNIHVLGDASMASSMPKSGFSANSQAKVVANAVRGDLTGSTVYEPRFGNACWSLIATNDAVKVGANYAAGQEKFNVTDKFISKIGEDDAVRKATYEESEGWYKGITTDIFG